MTRRCIRNDQLCLPNCKLRSRVYQIQSSRSSELDRDSRAAQSVGPQPLLPLLPASPTGTCVCETGAVVVCNAGLVSAVLCDCVVSCSCCCGCCSGRRTLSVSFFLLNLALIAASSTGAGKLKRRENRPAAWGEDDEAERAVSTTSEAVTVESIS